MTDYFKIIRERFAEYGDRYFIGSCEIPQELNDYIYNHIEEHRDIYADYIGDNRFSEKSWADLERTIRVWNSPLEKALR